jgi:hypothetical protein
MTGKLSIGYINGSVFKILINSFFYNTKIYRRIHKYNFIIKF